jgi:hypothetical protein
MNLNSFILDFNSEYSPNNPTNTDTNASYKKICCPTCRVKITPESPFSTLIGHSASSSSSPLPSLDPSSLNSSSSSLNSSSSSSSNQLTSFESTANNQINNNQTDNFDINNDIHAFERTKKRAAIASILDSFDSDYNRDKVNTKNTVFNFFTTLALCSVHCVLVYSSIHSKKNK